MKQFQINYINEKRFLSEINQIKRYCNKIVDCKLIFHLSFVNASEQNVYNLISQIKSEFPDALYYGNESFGNIVEGKLSDEECLITCTIFEGEDSEIEIVRISMDEARKTTPLDKLWKYAKEKQNLKAIEVVSSYAFATKNNLIEEYVDLPRDVKVFGGVSINYLNPNSPSYVFSKDSEVSITDCIAILYCGKDLNVECNTVSGWKGLGRWMTVTKNSNNVLYEINETPAFDMYRKYLGMELEKNVFLNQSWFPLVIEKGGIEMVRCVATVNKDGSMLTLLNIEEGSKIRLSYGDHSSILVEVDEKSTEVAAFEPEVIKMFSCASRRMFWGDDDVSHETKMFNEIGDTEGFYTAGELLRIGDYLYEFNATIVMACMREGEAQGQNRYESTINRNELASTRNARLVSFVTAVTQDLELQYKETYRALNMDALTGICNRYAYEVYRKELFENPDLTNLVVVSADVNGLKMVNDNMGHEAGDELISGSAEVLECTFGKYGRVFRTGGDEFIAIIFADEPEIIKEDFLKEMNSWKGTVVESMHISIGMAGFGEFPDSSLEEIEKMADSRMYEDKRNYYIQNHIERRKR